jgi:hypothetical protein
VTTKGGPDGEKTLILGVERNDRNWNVSRVFDSVAEAKLLPAPEANTAPPTLRRPGAEDEPDDGTGAEDAGEEGASDESAASDATPPSGPVEKKPVED